MKEMTIFFKVILYLLKYIFFVQKNLNYYKKVNDILIFKTWDGEFFSKNPVFKELLDVMEEPVGNT